jgi:hypothetical protein
MSRWKIQASIYAPDDKTKEKPRYSQYTGRLLEIQNNTPMMTTEECRIKLIKQGAFGRSPHFLTPEEMKLAPPEMTSREWLEYKYKRDYGELWEEKLETSMSEFRTRWIETKGAAAMRSLVPLLCQMFGTSGHRGKLLRDRRSQ